MVATSAHHIVRVTMRVSVAGFHRDIDVTLPTSSTFAEVLPELARLVDLPEIHRPWEVSTVGGAPLDMHTPLYQLKLFDGSAVALRPQEHVAPPVVRDAADALREVGHTARQLRGLDIAATYAGLVALFMCAGVFFTPAQALAVTGLVALCVAVVGASRAVYFAVPCCFALCAGLWVAGPDPQGADVAYGVFAAAAAAALAAGAGMGMRLFGAAEAAFVCAVCAMVSCGALGVWLPAALAPAALTLLAAVLLVMATPGTATRVAGLAVPRVPTAGEEFDRADAYQLDVDARSRSAASVAAALSVAVTVCALPALARIALAGGVWPFALCVCLAGALVVHASRHHWAVPRACLTAVALAAVVAAAVSAARGEVHPAVMVIAMAVSLGAATAVVWAQRVGDLEPTTVVWFERAEAAAIIAFFPLAVHLTGLFDLIRGL